MDPKPQMPEIKVEVNREGSRPRAQGGLLASLLAGGGSTAGGGASGLGALLGGAGGGLLATKAGVVAVAVVGSALASVVGFVGHRMISPAESAGGGGLQLFAQRTSPAKYDPNVLPAASADGTSASLDALAKASARGRAEEEASAAAEEAALEQSAASDAASAPPAGGVLNPTSGTDAATGGATRALAGVGKFGEFSKGAAGGASTTAKADSASAAARVSNAAAAGGGVVAGGKAGATNAFARGLGARASARAGRGIAGHRNSSARQQLSAVMRDQRGAGASMSAGATYDGARAGGEIGGAGGVIEGGGAPAQPKTLGPNNLNDVDPVEPPEPTPKHMITPWQKAVQRAQMLVMVAVALAFAASKVPDGPQSKMIKMAIGIAILAIGGYIGLLAGKVMSGKEGQKLQGMAVAAAAAGVIITGLGVMMGGGKDCKGGSCGQSGGASGASGASGGAGAGAGGAGGGCSGGAGGLLGGINPMILLGGGLAAVSMIGVMFMPKPKPIEVEKGKEGQYDITLAPPNYRVDRRV